MRCHLPLFEVFHPANTGEDESDNPRDLDPVPNGDDDRYESKNDYTRMETAGYHRNSIIEIFPVLTYNSWTIRG